MDNCPKTEEQFSYIVHALTANAISVSKARTFGKFEFHKAARNRWRNDDACRKQLWDVASYATTSEVPLHLVVPTLSVKPPRVARPRIIFGVANN